MSSALDDLIKMRRGRDGLPSRVKLAGQVVIALAAALMLHQHLATIPGSLTMRVPLMGALIDLGWWFVPLGVLVMVGSSNANLFASIAAGIVSMPEQAGEEQPLQWPCPPEAGHQDPHPQRNALEQHVQGHGVLQEDGLREARRLQPAPQ